jgi:hypothetical protein
VSKTASEAAPFRRCSRQKLELQKLTPNTPHFFNMTWQIDDFLLDDREKLFYTIGASLLNSYKKLISFKVLKIKVQILIFECIKNLKKHIYPLSRMQIQGVPKLGKINSLFIKFQICYFWIFAFLRPLFYKSRILDNKLSSLFK